MASVLDVVGGGAFFSLFMSTCNANQTTGRHRASNRNPLSSLPTFSAPISRLSFRPPPPRWRRSVNTSRAPPALKESQSFPVIPKPLPPPRTPSWTTTISILVLSTSLRMHNNFGRVNTYSFSFSFLAKFGSIELEDILGLPTDPSLLRLDSTLKRFTSFCASYHGTPFHGHMLPHQSFIPNLQQNNIFKLLCNWSMRVSSCSSQSYLPSTRKGCAVISWTRSRRYAKISPVAKMVLKLDVP